MPQQGLVGFQDAVGVGDPLGVADEGARALDGEQGDDDERQKSQPEAEQDLEPDGGRKNAGSVHGVMRFLHNKNDWEGDGGWDSVAVFRGKNTLLASVRKRYPGEHRQQFQLPIKALKYAVAPP